MASQLEFEGPVLEDLLERVRAEVGPDARIVAANRVRKGGVGGFFAKEAFEVLVEPAAAAEAATTVPTAGATEHAAVPDAGVHATILELAEAVNDYERSNVIDLVEDRSVSTESRGFAQVLDRVSRSIDATPEELRGPSGSDIDLRESDPTTETQPRVDPPPAPLPSEPVDIAPRPSDDDDLGHAPMSSSLVSPKPQRIRQSAHVISPVAGVIDRYETRLSRMGLPARLIPRGVDQHALKGALVESLTRLPPAPSVPQALGVVIATVGVGSAPVLLARDLANDLGLDPDDVVLATPDQLGFGIPAWLQMSDAETALERSRSWRRRNRPTIVACSMPVLGLRWARAMLDNLEPTITWAIVDARSKREDIVHRVESLGGVDVLALDGLDETVSPAAVLELGIPVGRLADEHASPLTWTELLLERMQS